MITVLLIIIIVFCAVAIAVIVARKLPVAARINVEEIHDERESRLKKRLIQDRLYRKWTVVGSFLLKWIKPAFQRLKEGFHHWLSAIQARERSLHAEQLKQRPEPSVSFDHLRPQLESLIVSKNYVEVESRLIEFIALNPKHLEAYKFLAGVSMEKKDYRQAQEIYEFILKMDEKNRETYSALGRLFSEENKSEEARTMFEQSASLHSSDATDYSSLAKLYQTTGELDRALEAIRKACELQPQNPKFLDKLAELAILSGRKAVAKNAYLKLKKVNPENEKLASIKEQIDGMK